VLEATRLNRSFRQGSTTIRPVVDVSMRLQRGEFAAIVGSSGSGKTTLLQLLGALDRPDSGEVLVDGRSTGDLGDRELTRMRSQRIGIVFQQFNLVPTLTAVENVEAALVGVVGARAARTARALELLEQVGLADRADHVPARLSGGEQQRVAIARALAAGPGLVLADEPTGNLDRATGEQVLDLLVRLVREQDLVLLVVTHDERVAARADRVFEIDFGRLTERMRGSRDVAARATAPETVPSAGEAAAERPGATSQPAGSSRRPGRVARVGIAWRAARDAWRESGR
jgi:putative ABC transport system ATP-binding protein